MVEKGSKCNSSAASKALRTKWQVGDIVARQEQNEDETFSNILYKVVEVPLEHGNASIFVDVITLQWFSPVSEEEENGLMEYKLHVQQWCDTADKSRYDATFTANTMAWVDPAVVTITSGKICIF